MRIDVIRRAADLAASRGTDIDEPLRLWEIAGGMDGGRNAQIWLSVAFMFSRHERVALITGAPEDTLDPVS